MRGRVIPRSWHRDILWFGRFNREREADEGGFFYVYQNLPSGPSTSGYVTQVSICWPKKDWAGKGGEFCGLSGRCLGGGGEGELTNESHTTQKAEAELSRIAKQ